MGIEPTSSAWKAEVLPLNYTRLPFSPFLWRTKILTVSLFKPSGCHYSYRCLVEGVGFEPT